MSENGITTEIRKFIADKVAAGQTVQIDWLTHEIITKKADIAGGDVEFYRVCAYKHVRDVVKQCVGRYKPQPKQDQQLVLATFEHLQVAYSFMRDDEIVLVPLHQLSDQEIEDRAKEYERMAESCRAHAKELRDFARNRGRAA